MVQTLEFCELKLSRYVVRQLSNTFELDVDMLDGGTGFCLQTAMCVWFQFLVGATFAELVVAAMLDFRSGRPSRFIFAVSLVLISLHL